MIVELVLALAGMAAVPEPPVPPAIHIAPATIDDTLEVTGETIDARQIASRLLIPVRINGSGPYRFLVDSGADRSVIGIALARKLALPAGRQLLLQSTSGSSVAESVLIDSLQVGAGAIRDIVAPTLDEGHLGAQGLIGIDALAGQRLMLDFEKRAITLQDNDRPEARPFSDDIVVIARRRRGQLILTQATIGSTRVSAVIDTGAQITIGNPALQARLLRARDPSDATPVALISVTGQAIMAHLLIVPELRIAGLTLRNVTVAFADAPPFRLFGLADEPAILLGSDLLQAFRRVSLDFKRRKVRFTLPKGAATCSGIGHLGKC